MKNTSNKTKETDISSIIRKLESDFDWNFVLVVSIFIFLMATFFSMFIKA